MLLSVAFFGEAIKERKGHEAVLGDDTPSCEIPNNKDGCIHATRHSSVDITISYPPKGRKLEEREQTIGGDASSPSGISKVEVRLNGGEWKEAVIDKGWSTVVTLESGNNTIEVRATDNDGDQVTEKVTVNYAPNEADDEDDGGFPTWAIIVIGVVVVVIILIILYEIRR